MKINQKLNPAYCRLEDNEFYLQLNQYFLAVLKDSPEYTYRNAIYDKGEFKYELSDSERLYYETNYYPLSKLVTYTDNYPILFNNFRIDELPSNKVSEREYDILQLIYGENQNSVSVLKGNVGWGKSTLLRYVICYLFQFRNSRKIIPIYIDFNEMINMFNSCETKLEAINLFNNTIFKEKILRIIGPIYDIDNEDLWNYIKEEEEFSEYKVLEKNIHKLIENKDQKLLALRFEWISKNHTILYALKYYLVKYSTRLVVILDNLDPINDFCSKGIYLEIYQFCMKVKCKSIISFRPNTFNEILNKREGIYDTMSPQRIPLDPPKASEIFESSIEILRSELSSKKASITLSTVRLETEDTFSLVLSFLKLLENENISNMLDSISQGNLRTWAKLIRTYFSSGHLKSHKLLSNYLKQELLDDNNDKASVDDASYNPEWIAYSSIITTNYKTFFPANRAPTTKDLIINLFNNKSWSTNNQFIRLHILFFLSRDTANMEFLISMYADQFGSDPTITEKSIHYALRILINSGLVTSNKYYKIDSDKEAGNIQDIEINPMTGSFYINFFLYNFEYLYYIKDDVDLDMEAYSNIKGCLQTNWLNERFHDVVYFIDYIFRLEKQYLSKLTDDNKKLFMDYFSPFHTTPFYSFGMAKHILDYGTARRKLGISNEMISSVNDILEQIKLESSKFIKKIEKT
jgi:hypothetical protein